jgi:hypothetical protein
LQRIGVPELVHGLFIIYYFSQAREHGGKILLTGESLCAGQWLAPPRARTR